MDRRTEASHDTRDAQRDRSHRPRSLADRLLQQPRRTAGIDLYGQPVRLGERDTDGHLVGYIDGAGLAWESLAERIVAEYGNYLGKALALPHGDPRRDRLMDEVLAGLPDELIGDVARAAGTLLAIRDLAQGLDP
jgi:hypothetical protein